MTTATVPDTEQLLGVARDAVAAGAGVAMAWRRDLAGLEVEEKAAPDDLVSEADRDAERAIRAAIAKRRPADAVLGEEAGGTRGATRVRWLIDPIDGTTSYLQGRSDWAVSVAAVGTGDGRPFVGVVAEPALGRVTEAALGRGTWSSGRRLLRSAAVDLSRALVEVNLGRDGQRELAGELVASLLPRIRDLRRGGSAASALAQVADGRADAYWGPGLQAWDGAAGALLVSEAGGIVGDLAGRTDGRWPASGDVLASRPGLWDELRSVLAGVYDVPGR